MSPVQTIKQQKILTDAHRDYEKGLNLHAYFRVHNRATSEDLVQETFMKAWAYLVKGGKIDLMKAFLYHILNNLVVDEYRKHRTSSLDVLLENGFEPSVGEQRHFTDVLDGKASLLLIDQLPDRYKNVMRLRYEQNLSLEEISRITGQSKNTVAVQQHRALEKLKVLCEAN